VIHGRRRYDVDVDAARSKSFDRVVKERAGRVAGVPGVGRGHDDDSHGARA
jgi:hypothetical protein